MDFAIPSRWRDAALPIALALVLSAVWTLRDWGNLSALRLPDTDDVMRLQQIRDWLAGQPFADLSQHRLAGGLPMHWSRLPDLVPGATIAALAPMLGRHAAEVAAVIAWPALLFAAMLALIRSIGRAMGGSAVAAAAMLVGGLAYPANSLFLPGRIDHHGLQCVLLLAVVRAMLAPRGASSGTSIAVASVASVVVGMEFAPFLLLAAALPVAGWVFARDGAGRQLAALGATAAAALVAALAFAPEVWAYPACDGFTRMTWQAAMVAAPVPLLLAAIGHVAGGRTARMAAAGAMAAVVAAIEWRIAPGCLSPYGAVDPLVARLWLARVAEAQPLFAAPLAVALAQGGLMLAGIAAGLGRLRATRDPGWAILLLFQGVALAIACAQLRGANAGALLAAPALGATIVAARGRGAAWLAGAWLASAGIVYPLAAEALPQAPAPAGPSGTCTAPATLARLAALPPGRLMAPIDLGAFALAATRLEVIAAPYHRDNAGNAAMYRFFLGDERAARRIAARWRMTHVAWCRGSFAGLDLAPDRARLADRLEAGNPPAWLVPIGAADGDVLLFAVRGLSDGASAL